MLRPEALSTKNAHFLGPNGIAPPLAEIFDDLRINDALIHAAPH